MVWGMWDWAETQPTNVQLQPTLPTHMDESTWVVVSHLGSFCYWGQFQHLYTLACNWVEIGANMSERCRNLMIIKVITRLACLIRRVLFPTLILWWIIRPGHCLGTDPQPCVYILLSKNPFKCQKEMSKLHPMSRCWCHRWIILRLNIWNKCWSDRLQEKIGHSSRLARKSSCGGGNNQRKKVFAARRQNEKDRFWLLAGLVIRRARKI